MTDQDTTVREPSAAPPAKPEKRGGLLRRSWRKVRKPLAQSRLAKVALANLILSGLRFVKATNPVVPGSDPFEEGIRESTPAIFALWHGQHLFAPLLYPRDVAIVAMVSRSADAELNALVLERLGFGTARGSGGRQGDQQVEKGGARALIMLKRVLDKGMNAAMIADIPKGTPREAGMGIVTLARISGKPIVPLAVATSRRKVLEKSWDKTTISLPFGRRSTVVGEPVVVPPDADEAELERCRQAVTQNLDAATRRAYELVDGRATSER